MKPKSIKSLTKDFLKSKGYVPSDIYIAPYTKVKGFLYIVCDDAYSSIFKVGKTTNMNRRLEEYNSTRPIPSVYPLYISRVYEDYTQAEKDLLNYIASNNIQPIEGRLEWFNIKELPFVKKWFEEN